MLNQCNFIGRTGKDIELRYTPAGKAVANVSIAVSEKYKDKQGQQQENTEWVNVVAWDKLAEIMGKYVKKGDLIYVSGKMQTRSYDDRDGNKRYITEIRANQMQMLGGKGESHGGESRQGGNQGQHGEYHEDDSIPF